MDMLIKDLMTPVAQFVRVTENATLADCFAALQEAETGARTVGETATVEILVESAGGKVVGKVTMLDVFLALEPAYKDISAPPTATSVLTPEYLAKVYKDFGLWADPLATLCRRTAGLTAGEVMHRPQPAEFVRETDSLDVALHRHVMGVHQPLLVVDADGKVRGVLNAESVYARVRELVLACPV